MRALIEKMGASLLDFNAECGRILFLLGSVLRHLFSRAPRIKMIAEQIIEQGVQSVGVIMLTAVATGAVLAVQAGVTLARFGANAYIAQMVALSMVRELGPIIAAIVFTGKSGAKMTAELGSMAVNEQIKATRAMALDPVEFFVTSRFVACVMVLPLLEVIANFVGMIGGFIIAVTTIHIPAVTYYNQTIASLGMFDLWFGFIKSIVFAVIIALICCYKGLSTRGGATGVGRFTTDAVALCIISIITMNFLLTKILLVVLG